jgi:transaldolase
MDNLTRGMMTSGALQRRVTAQGVRGITSNPAIVHQAISGRHDSDTPITQLISQGLTSGEIYERLVVTDVQAACAAEASGPRRDGYGCDDDHAR